MDTDTIPICIRCLETFPVAAARDGFNMGTMRPVSEAPGWMQRKLNPDHEDMRGTPHLCGNCYFDLLDERDDRG